MRQEILKWRDRVGLGIIASVALHLTVGTALLVNLPFDLPKPEPEESVAVELVPPPEEEKPEDKPAEPEAEASEKDAKQEAVAPPPPPAEMPPEAQQAEAEAPPPPEPQPEEPPPPPPPAEEQAVAEPPPPPAPEADAAPQPEAVQQQAEQQPPTAGREGEGRELSIAALQQAFEFGETDSGPRETVEGNSSRDGQAAEEETPATPVPEQEVAAFDAQQPTEDAVEPTTEPDAAATPSEGPEAGSEAQTGNLLPDGIEAPAADFETTSPSAGAADDGKAGVLAMPVPKPGSDEPNKVSAAAPRPLKSAKTLFSQRDTAETAATRAMGNLPRDVRAGQLCTTELRQQLLNMVPRYFAEILPQYKLPEGTVMVVEDAFRAEGQWYDIRFRCEFDEQVTKVVSFAYDVGQAIPRSEWKARRFPSF